MNTETMQTHHHSSHSPTPASQCHRLQFITGITSLSSQQLKVTYRPRLLASNKCKRNWYEAETMSCIDVGFYTGLCLMLSEKYKRRTITNHRVTSDEKCWRQWPLLCFFLMSSYNSDHRLYTQTDDTSLITPIVQVHLSCQSWRFTSLLLHQ